MDFKKTVKWTIVGMLIGFVSAQTSMDPAFRISSKTRMVLVDLLVTGPDGKLVTDLRSEELEIFEEGKRQVPLFLRLESAFSGPVAEPAPPMGSPARIVPEGAIVSGDPIRHSAPTDKVALVFVLDLATISPDAMVRVKSEIGEFLSSPLPPGSRFMLAVVDNSLEIRQPFTDRMETFRQAVESINAKAGGDPEVFSVTRFIEDVETIFEQHENTNTYQEAADESTQTARTFLVTLDRRIESIADTLTALSSYLGSLPGRKHVVFFSAGYPITAPSMLRGVIEARYSAAMGTWTQSASFIRPDFSATLSSDQSERWNRRMQTVIDNANRALVSIYAIDTQGMVAAGGSGEAQRRIPARLVRQNFYSQFVPASLNASQENLSGLSEGTGGICVKNNNDLQRGIQFACKDALQYYLVGYSPSNESKPGKYREIKVTVRRPNVTIRFRQGYLALDDSQVANRDVMNAFKFPGLFQDYSTIETEKAGGKTRFTILVPTKDLVFRCDGDQCECPVDFFGALFDSGGQIVGDQLLFQKGLKLRFHRSELNGFLSNETISKSFEAAIPPGAYRLTVVVRQGAFQRLATSSMWLESR